MSGARHDLVADNSYIRLFPDGTVLTSERRVVVISNIFVVSDIISNIKLISLAKLPKNLCLLWEHPYIAVIIIIWLTILWISMVVQLRFKRSIILIIITRLTVVLRCPMNIANFPFDSQNCPLQIASCRKSWIFWSFGPNFWLTSALVPLALSFCISMYHTCIVWCRQWSSRVWMQHQKSAYFIGPRPWLSITLQIINYPQTVRQQRT